MPDWIPDHDQAPGPFRTSLYGALAACIILGSIAAGAMLDVVTRAWPKGGDA